MFGFDFCSDHKEDKIKSKLYASAARYNRLEHYRNIKMTREEAKTKINNSFLNPQAVDDWLTALEALGLIKFDEPTPQIIKIGTVGYKLGDIRVALFDAGYTVEKY